VLSRIAAVIPAVLAAGVACAPLAHAAGSYSITINGQVVASGSNVVCQDSSSGGLQQMHIYVPGSPGFNPSQAPSATVVIKNGYLASIAMAVNYQGQLTKWQGGNTAALGGTAPTVTNTGNAYKVVGDLMQMNGVDSGSHFEFDATCP
jgi:hypothetical protein